RIRRGETPEQVAETADVSLERIMGYAFPVLAEREHVVQQARSSTLRQRHSRNSTRTLGEAVDDAMRTREIDPSAARWDSWRREVGRWTVVVDVGDQPRCCYTYDAPGRYVTPDRSEEHTS